jgi:hypothetical protein
MVFVTPPVPLRHRQLLTLPLAVALILIAGLFATAGPAAAGPAAAPARSRR